MLTRLLTAVLISILTLAASAQVDRSKQPQPGPAPVIELSDYTTFSQENGLKVIVVENHKLPRVTFSLMLDIDPVLQRDSAGYVSAAGQLLRGGTKTRTKDQLDEEIDFIGANISTSSTGVYASSLKKHTDKLLGLMADVIINSDFKPEELEKIKLRMQSDVAQSKDDPGSIAERTADAVRYGKDHPYGEHITEQTIKNITLDKCKNYYQAYFKPNTAYLAVVGDITEDEVKPLLEKYFSNWQKGDVPENTYTVPKPPDKTEVVFVDRPNSVQSVIDVTYPVQIKIGDEDEISANVMNTVLGGGVFRLFNNLREKHAYTYGAYSNLAKDELVGNFSASAEVRNQVTDSSITEILYEMKRIKEELVPEDEMVTAKNYLTGNFAISLEQPQTIARFALNIGKYNLPKDYYANYLKKVAAVTAEDVQKAARKYILPDQSYIVVVGSKDQTAEKLSTFGVVTYRDVNGEVISESTRDLGNLTGNDVINNYITAIGGKENLAKVQDRKTVLEGTVQGMNLTMTSYQKAPDFLKQEIKAGGMEQVILYDGAKGVFIMNGQQQKITDSELEKLALESKINLLLDLQKEGIETTLLGKEAVDGKDAYKVEMKFSSGTKWIQYYDVSTGLKVKEIKPITSPQGTFSQETVYEDYREINGVKYPFLLKQSLGPQKIDMKVTSVEVNTGLKDDFFTIK